MPTKSHGPRLAAIPTERLTPEQRTLRDAIVASRKLPPSAPLGGPFGVFLHAPAFGEIVQRLGAHCRYKTAMPPRLSEFAILCVARLWRAQFEWHAHAPIAEKAGVKPQTLKDLRAGRIPKRAAKDERALYDFIAELHRSKRVGDRNYGRAHAVLGDTGMVEFVGLLGYYTLVAMSLNAFRVPLPEGAAIPFREPAIKR